MKSLKSIFIYLVLSLLFLSCGNGRSELARTDFSFSLAGVATVAQMPGGFYLWATQIDPDTLEVLQVIKIDLDENAADIPFGTWSFDLVGYEGPAEWSGTKYCGSLRDEVLDSSETNLVISISTSNCTTFPIFQQMIAQKQLDLAGGLAIWDAAAWDATAWGP